MALKSLLFVGAASAAAAQDFAGACSAADLQAIAKLGGGDAEGSFAKTTDECSKNSLGFSGIEEAKFNPCLQGKVSGLSTGCSTCFWNAAQYGFEHCKLPCLFNWCSSKCLDCAKGYDIDSCTGSTGGPQPTPCSDASDAEEFVQGKVLKLTWSDCGDASTHTKITGLKPDTLTLGTKTTIVGSGNLDEAVTAGTFEIDMSAGIIKQTFNGDACAAKSFKLPLGMGSLAWGGLKCPVAAGSTSVSTDVQLSGLLPVSLAKATLISKATATNGDKLLCLKVTTAPAAEVGSEVEVVV